MKKIIFGLLAFAFTIAVSLPATAKTIWNVSDSGSCLYIVKSLTNTPTVLSTFRVDKKGCMVNTANSFLYIKDVNSVIYPINFGGDSIIIAGLAPAGGTVAIKLAACASVLQSMIGHLYVNYLSKVTTVALVKTGRGFLHTICIDSIGVGGLGTFYVWDGTGASDTVSTSKPLFEGTILTVGERLKDVQFNKGLYIKQKTTTAGRISISYYLIAPPEREFYNSSFRYVAPYRYVSSF